MKNIIYSAMIALVITFSITAYSDGLASDLENGLIRLHIIADSDSERDQNIKLVIRDAILDGTQGISSPHELSKCAEEIANYVLKENGFSYGAAAQYCIAEFPKKKYREFTLPAGKYRAVRVVLGSGKGQNWWCVLYPPVCMADTKGENMSKEARAQLKNNLNKETYDVITGGIKIKFRIAEIIKNLCAE